MTAVPCRPCGALAVSYLTNVAKPSGPSAQRVIDKANIAIIPFLPHWDTAIVSQCPAAGGVDAFPGRLHPIPNCEISNSERTHV